MSDVVEVVRRAIAAWENGEPLELPGPGALPRELEEALHRLIASGPPAFRTGLAGPLVEKLERDLAPPRHLFPVEQVEHQPPSHPNAAAPSNTPIEALHCLDRDRPVRLRVDQALAARAWSIGFTGGEEGLPERLETRWRQLQLQRFSGALNFLSRMQPPSKRQKIPPLVPDPIGASFEQLVLDLLNEEELVAHHASVEEDLYEKTDLRVKLPELQRRRGARVQVTLMSEPAKLEEKLRRIRWVRELVVVSPLTLAQAAITQSGTTLFPKAESDPFWSCLPKSTDPITVARALKQRLLSATTAPPAPEGPRAHVPEPIRRFIRRYVRNEALRSSAEMRERMEAAGPARSPSDGGGDTGSGS